MEILDKQVVVYSNNFEFNGVKLAFKKKMLFDISSTPRLINHSDNGWWVNRKLLTVSKIKELIKNELTTIDISDLSFAHQCHLQECFNLNL